MQATTQKESEKLHKFTPNLPEKNVIQISKFYHYYDHVPKRKILEIDDFFTTFKNLKVTNGATDKEKMMCPAWSPATFKAGFGENKFAGKWQDEGWKLASLVEELSALVLDIDSTTLAIKEVEAGIGEAFGDILFLVHTTFSHTENVPCYRVVIPFAKPCPASDFSIVWRSAEAAALAVGITIDGNCKNINRIYFFPSCPKSRKEIAEMRVHEGTLFDWQSLVDTNIAPPLPKPLKTVPNPFADMPSNLDEHVDRAKLSEALEFISPDEYDPWMKVGMGLRALHEEGFLMWDAWSSKSEKYPGRAELLNKWSSFKPGGGVGFGTIFHFAKMNGFVIDPPVNVVAQTENTLQRDTIEIPKVFTELAVAGAVRQAFGNKFCYVPQTAKWHAIDEFNVWRVDLSGQVNRYVFEVIKEAKKHACSLIMSGKDDAGKSLLRDITKAEKNGFVIGVVSLMRSLDGMTINSSHFDSDPLLVGLAGGQVLDLRTSTVRAMRPEDHISKTLGTCFDAAATCPRWVQFIDEVTCGDKELCSYLQVLSGYVLSGLNEMHVFWLLFGSGRNGKSIFLNMLLALLSDYAVMLPAEAITLSKNGNDNSSDIARLDGARLALTNEIAEGQHYHENRIKQLTGGDKITGRLLYAEPFDFFNCAKLLQGANYKPIVKGTDAAIWDRLQLVPFRAYFPNPDRQLAEKLKAELPGILNWAVDGWKIYQSKGLEIPSAVANESKAYKQEQDLTGQFLEQTCAVAVGNKVKSSELYSRFRMWCQDNGFYVPNSSAFGRRVANRLKSKREAAGVFYLDIKMVG